MDWGFLDETDKNLLYTYAKSFSKANGKAHFKNINAIEKDENELKNDTEKLLEAEQKKKTAYYLIWFVYRYVLECKTLEEALKYADEETFKKHKLVFFLNKRYVYIGLYGDGEIYLYNYKEGDIAIVLEILYNRYNFFEQLECYIKRTEHLHRSLRKRCIGSLEKYREMLKGNEKFDKLNQKKGF